MNFIESCFACDIFQCREFYRYVLNSGSCHSKCFGETCSCDCNTNEIQIPPPPADDLEIALAALEICCDSTRLTHYSSSQDLSEKSATLLDL